MDPSWFILADESSNPRQWQAAASVLFWGTILLAVVLLGGAAVLRYRVKLLHKGKPEAAPGFGLSDLRALQAAGHLSPEEFQAAHDKIVRQTKGSCGSGDSELTLPQIDALLDQGELTPEQYAAERKKIIARLKA